MGINNAADILWREKIFRQSKPGATNCSQTVELAVY